MPLADPLVILALPRSYSTLACAMLGQHPQMYGLPEMNLFLTQSMQEWWMKFGINYSAGLSRAIAEVIFGRQTEATVVQARYWLWQRRGWDTGDVLWELAERIYPLILVEKNPLEGGRKEIQESLQRRIRVFPQAKFLHLVRHPLGYGQSYLQLLEEMATRMPPFVMARLSARLLDKTTDCTVLDPQRQWCMANSNILSFLAQVPPAQQMRVRGEDLLADPERYLREIAEWMQLRSDAEAIEAMKHPEDSPFAGFGPRNALLGGDPSFFRHPALRTGKVKGQSLDGPLPWRRDGLGFREEVRELARQFGYT
jgi:hypothetical protein